jgi:ABC-type uncharacterized transport system permease subunit
MTSTASIAFYIVMVVYSAAATLFFVDLARPDVALGPSRWAPRTLIVGVCLHALYIVLGLGSAAVTPGSLKFALSLCALSVSVAYLLLRQRMRVEAIGVAVAPLSLTLVVGSEFLRASGPVTDFPRTLLLMHVAANILGFGLFLLAGAAGGFYLFQERRLKAKRIPALNGRLPPLDALDLTEHRLLLAGFPLLTFGIVSGAVFAARLDTLTSAGVARAALAYATWILVAGVLVLRAVAGWRGRRAAYGTLAGVACVLLVLLIYVAKSGGGGGL